MKECICGGDIQMTDPDDDESWVHVSTLDKRCYPEDPAEWRAKATPNDYESWDR